MLVKEGSIVWVWKRVGPSVGLSRVCNANVVSRSVGLSEGQFVYAPFGLLLRGVHLLPFRMTTLSQFPSINCIAWGRTVGRWDLFVPTGTEKRYWWIARSGTSPFRRGSLILNRCFVREKVLGETLGVFHSKFPPASPYFGLLKQQTDQQSRSIYPQNKRRNV